MAAEPTRIKLKRSTTAAVVPTTSNLLDGEVAVNIADRKVYVRNGGSIIEVANQKPNTGEVTTSMFATDVTNGPGQTFYVAKNGSDVTTLTNGGANGKHPDTPFLTVAKALSLATSGDTINIGAGTFQETFPLTVPDGVTVRGANLRSTQIYPSSATNDLNAFVLEGDSHVSDLTVKDFFYNSGNDTGYGFVCASSLDSERSPYIERVTVLTKGSVTSGSDPYGFSQGDAGRGAKLDGALFSSNSIEAAILFNEVTFIVPNSVGLLITNGVRVEWLNSFVYFASEGIKGVQGSTGRAGAGQTRLKLSGVSGTFAAAEVIYQLEDSFKSGTYSRSGTTVTVTKNSHGCQNGDVIYADFISGGGTDGYYTVANVATNTFEVTDTASGTTSGNITYKKADAYGTITTNDGTYLLINGKGTGEFTTGVPTGKTGVIAGDAQLDTAQKKFGTASLLLDGTTDHLNYPTDQDFGFGTTNFAVECFIRPASVSGTQYFLDFRDASASDTAPVLYLDGTTLHYAVGNTSQISGGTLASNTWYHVAVARSGGTTKLFLDGTELGTYSDSNDYGATKPLGIGGQYSGADEFGGHIDEVRVSKASARYTAAFTAPTTAFTTDLYTVLLLHFDGTDGSTTITDSGKGVKDIRSNGGDSATSILTADYAQFGAELRGISSANIYGTKGAVADGAGVKILLTAHNFAYIGAGADFTNDPSLAVPANEVTETNGGKVFYSATNQNGDFRIGDAFVVDQQTGNVQFQSTSTAQEAANITLSDATGTTRIFPAFVETGNLRLSGNTLSSTSGGIIVDPSADEDITLNAETIATEQLYFRTDKKVGIQDRNAGAGAFNIASEEQAGWSTYGLYSNKNLSVFNVGISSVNIVAEGSEYAANTYTLTAVSNPTVNASLTAVLDATGGVKTVTLTNNGSGYTQVPVVNFVGSATTPATAQVTLASFGSIKSVTVDQGGSGYASPTITFDNPPDQFFGVDSEVSTVNNTITYTSGVIFENDDTVVYSNQGGSENIGLVDGTTYYVINVNTTANTLQLSTSQGGSAISLTTGTQSEQHSLRGTVATGTVQESGGVITGVTITNSGVKYSQSTSATITGAPGAGATISVLVGRKIESITASDAGAGYSSAPSVTITGDGTGAAATTTLGYQVASVTINNAGEGYSITPTINVSGGDPTSPASFTAVFGKKSGFIESVTIDDPGELFSTAPTLEVVGGAGADANLSVNILPFEGTISNNGSGYAAGVYNNVPFTGGSPTAAATATITVPGLGGTITNAGSGYTTGTHTPISVRNAVGTTYVVTVVNREQLTYTSLSGGTFAASDTITGNGSGASATAVFAGTNANGDDVLRFTSITNGPFQNGETITNGTATATVGTVSNVNVYVIDGSETPVISLASHNTYRFDMSDSSNTGHPFQLQNFGTGQFIVTEDGTPGNTGAYVEVIAKDTAAPSTGTVSYYCTAHGGTMGNYVTVTNGSGSPGVYGDGLTATVTVDAGGIVTGFTIVTQGSGYKITDSFGLPGTSQAGSGTSFLYTINSLNTGISSVTNISPNGGPYTLSDVLSVDPNFDGVGSGSSFAFTLSKVGFVNSVTVNDGGYGFSSGDAIKLLSGPTTNGTDFSLSVNTTVDSVPIEVRYDGGITSANWNIDKNGSGTIGVTGSSLILHDVTTDGITNQGNIGTATLSVTTSAQISNLTAGGSNTIADATIKLADGTAGLPSLALENSNTTGLYRAAADDIGLSISGTQRGSISASGFDLSTDLVVDQNLAEATPFFQVSATGETVVIGAAATQLQINNDASIQSVGTDANVDITINPKGTGNLILTGGTDQDFSITDGSTETFRVDTENGNTTVGGRLDINGNVRIEDNIIASTIAQNATTSFGQIITISATGTGTGFTDNTYTGVTSTSNGSGTGATFNVTVSGGDITVITVNAGGAGYVEGEEITLNAAQVGSGTGKTITVTDIEGAGLVLKPSPGKNVKVDATSMFVVPSGTTNQRPPSGDRQVGGVRFNTEQQQFEGYNGTDFVSLGGVRDVDQDTYILTESAPGADEDTFEFYNQGVNSLSLNQTTWTLRTARTFNTTGTLNVNGTTLGANPFEVQIDSAPIFQAKSNKELEISGGLTLKGVPVLGEIASIGSITAGTGVYGASQTYSGVVSSSQFEGIGAEFTVVTDGSGSITSVTISAAGAGYEANEVITLDGSLLGGATPTNDVTFPVATLANAGTAFARMNILQQDFVTQLDNKPFISLDANASEAAWKINRGWNGGTESYLTVMDSTADFVELDDCRVEGGQLTSFTTSSTLTQFDKTAYKGAKTLVTIESNDGKVHMLEVTSVCAAAGTNAYATVTNSVTSDNDLVDASIAVVGNNVQVTVTKSSAATSSTTFTGRFTTTKVKV